MFEQVFESRVWMGAAMSALLAQVPGHDATALDQARALLVRAERKTGALRADIDDHFIPVPQALVTVLPHGLRRGSTVNVLGATSLAMTLISEASKQGAWAVIIGLPEWGAVAGSELGVVANRTALIPDAGTAGAAAIAAALDGIDLVLVGPRLIGTLTPGERRRLDNRARERGSILIACGHWEGSRTTITAASLNWVGLGSGDGFLRQRSYRVAARGRGVPGHSRDLDLAIAPVTSGQRTTGHAARSGVPTTRVPLAVAR